jgi:hypothetical protein
MGREINSKRPTDYEMSDIELDSVSAGGLWEAFVCFMQGGTDASHQHSRREGGGPRGG